MNMAAFAVIVARERETGLGDSIGALSGLGRERPLLAWPMTLAMLGLAGHPRDGGLHRQVLPDRGAPSKAATPGSAIVIVIGSMISLGYYLPVIAAMWMREAPAGRARRRPAPKAPAGCRRWPAARSELDEPRASSWRATASPRSSLVALLAGAATVVFGIVPQPLFDLVRHTGSALGLL